MHSRISVLLILLFAGCAKDPKVAHTLDHIQGHWILVSTSGAGGRDVPVLPWQKQTMEINDYSLREYAHDTLLTYDGSLSLETHKGTVCRMIREYTNDTAIVKYEQIFRRRDTLVRFMTETPGAVAYRYLPYKP